MGKSAKMRTPVQTPELIIKSWARWYNGVTTMLGKWRLEWGFWDLLAKPASPKFSEKLCLSKSKFGQQLR